MSASSNGSQFDQTSPPRAKTVGLGKDFTQALAIVVRNLRTTPADYGDPFVDFKALGLTLYSRIESPLRVTYAVDSKRRIVYLQLVRPFPMDAL